MGFAPSPPAPALSWCHPSLSPGPQASGRGVTHTACSWVPSLRQQLLGLLGLRHHRSQVLIINLPEVLGPVTSLETSDCYRG